MTENVLQYSLCIINWIIAKHAVIASCVIARAGSVSDALRHLEFKFDPFA